MTGLRVHWIWLFIFVGLPWHSTSWSEGAVPAGYRAIASEHRIPFTVFYAVALAESGKQMGSGEVYRPWPWTLNVAGQGYFFDSRLEAWRALTGWIKAGSYSIDSGLMQVNWRYHHERLRTPWQALDPYFNLRIGAEILQACYRKEFDWWASVGCYHSPANLHRANHYRRRVVARWQQIMSAG